MTALLLLALVLAVVLLWLELGKLREAVAGVGEDVQSGSAAVQSTLREGALAPGRAADSLRPDLAVALEELRVIRGELTSLPSRMPKLPPPIVLREEPRPQPVVRKTVPRRPRRPPEQPRVRLGRLARELSARFARGAGVDAPDDATASLVADGVTDVSVRWLREPRDKMLELNDTHGNRFVAALPGSATEPQLVYFEDEQGGPYFTCHELLRACELAPTGEVVRKGVVR